MSWFASRFLTDDECLTTEDLAREPVKEPSKAWRNRWRSKGDGFDDWGRFWRDGDICVSGCVYPSRDTAETDAARIIARDPRMRSEWEYLGAFPAPD